MYVFLSYPLDPKDLCWPGEPVLKVRKCTEINGTDVKFETCESVVPDHFGTHFDAPRHVNVNGPRIAELPPEYFVHQKVLLLDIPKEARECVMDTDLKPYEDQIAQCTLLLIRTGFGKKKFTEPLLYQNEGPCLHPLCSEYLVKTFPELRTVGLDFLSVGSPCNDLSADAHQMLLGCFTEHYVTAIEDMDLEAAGSRKIEEVTVAPLRIVGADSGQVCVIARMEDQE